MDTRPSSDNTSAATSEGAAALSSGQPNPSATSSAPRVSAIALSRSLLMEAIEAGALEGKGIFGHAVPMPFSGTSGRPYHGQNIFLLAAAAQAKGYESGAWVTANGAKSRGWHIRKDERHTKVFCYTPVEVPTGEVDPDSGDEIMETRPRLQWHRVFNLAQLDTSHGKPSPSPKGFLLPGAAPAEDALRMLDRIADGMGMEIVQDPQADGVAVEDNLITLPSGSAAGVHGASQVALALLRTAFSEGVPGRGLSADPELREAELHLRQVMAETLLSMRLGFPLEGATRTNADMVVKAMDAHKMAGLRASGDAEAAVRYLLSFDPTQAADLQAEGQSMHDEILDAGGADERAFDGAAIDFGYVEERTRRGFKP